MAVDAVVGDVGVVTADAVGVAGDDAAPGDEATEGPAVLVVPVDAEDSNAGKVDEVASLNPLRVLVVRLVLTGGGVVLVLSLARDVLGDADDDGSGEVVGADAADEAPAADGPVVVVDMDGVVSSAAAAVVVVVVVVVVVPAVLKG